MVVYGAGFIDTEREEFSDTPMDELLDLNIRMVKPGSIAVKFPDGRTAGADYTVEPRFAVDDPQATALAAYASNHKLVAAAEKGNMLFYGGALLDADFVRETARQSGAHIYCESTDNLAAGNGIVSIHCNQPGVKTIRFPEATDVVDLFGGEVLGRNVTDVSFPMKGFETRVLITGDADEMLSAVRARKKIFAPSFDITVWQWYASWFFGAGFGQTTFDSSFRVSEIGTTSRVSPVFRSIVQIPSSAGYSTPARASCPGPA